MRFQTVWPNREAFIQQKTGFVGIKSEELLQVLEFLKKNGFSRLCAITGLEIASGMQVLYHLANGEYIITLRVEIPVTNSSLPSITGIIQGANLYEREIHDLLGVKFDGHPDLRPLVLPDDWPKDVHPLRKEGKSQ